MRTAEEFRAVQHGGPHLLHVASCSDSDLRWVDPPPSDPAVSRRVVVHVDADCFYAQVEELRDQRLADTAVCVTQKYLVVTANYHARARGVAKLMSINDAKRLCPDAAFIAGEDLTPYRAVARRVRDVLSRFGPCEKLGLDESFIDVSDEVDRRIAAGGPGADPADVPGHKLDVNSEMAAANKHRPMDLKVASGTAVDIETHTDHTANTVDTLRVRIGSVLAQEARNAVFHELGVRCSAGVGVNKLCAKLTSGAHKPNDQTWVAPIDVDGLVRNLPVRALPGIGRVVDAELETKGVRVCYDARQKKRIAFVEWFGKRVGEAIHDNVWGIDRSEVVEKKPPAQITCQDSFRACSNHGAISKALRVLAPDLMRRIDEEALENSRLPKTLVLKFRLSGDSNANENETLRKSKWSITSATVDMPPEALAVRLGIEGRAAAVEAAAFDSLAKKLPKIYNLTLLALGAGSFFGNQTHAKMLEHCVDNNVLTTDANNPKQLLNATAQRRDYDSYRHSSVPSKHEERLAFEQSRGAVAACETGTASMGNWTTRTTHGQHEGSDSDEDGAAFFANIAEIRTDSRHSSGPHFKTRDYSKKISKPISAFFAKKQKQ